jgi:hypothetical protein
VKLFSDEQLKRLDIDELRRQLGLKIGGYIIAVKDLPAPSCDVPRSAL